MRPWSILLATVLTATACASPHRPAPAPPAPAPSLLDGFVKPADATEIDLPEDTITTVPAVVLGGGPRGVVLTPEHGGDICQWLPFGRSLAGQGYHVLIWDPGTDPLTDVAFLVGELRKAGATRVVLVGASNGANICTFAAARLRPAVDGLAWLSGEDQMFAAAGEQGQPVVRAARQLTVPALFIAAQDDLFRSARTAADLAAVAPAKEKKV